MHAMLVQYISIAYIYIHACYACSGLNGTLICNHNTSVFQVFISFPAYQEVCRIFDCTIHKRREKNFVPKSDEKIDYWNLLDGTLPEVRYVLARVIFDTVFPPDMEINHQDAVPED